MSRFPFVSTRRIGRASLLIALLGLSVPSFAGPIPFDVFLQFAFGEAGTAATGCDPEDPAGPFCIPSSGAPSLFLDAPPWTFLAPTDGATLTLIDAFSSGDQFEVFDFGTSLGLTSAPVLGADCGDDPVVCLADLSLSRGTFLLGAGLHSLTIVPSLSPEFGGSGYLKAIEGGGATPVSEPGILLLLGMGLVVIGAVRIRRSRAVERMQWVRADAPARGDAFDTTVGSAA